MARIKPQPPAVPETTGYNGKFVADALRKFMNERHFNQAQLAVFLGVDPAYVSRWLRGSSMRLDQLTMILGKMGWDLRRANPDYDVAADVAKTIGVDRMDLTNMESVTTALRQAKHKSDTPLKFIGIAEDTQVKFDSDLPIERVGIYKESESPWACPEYATDEPGIIVTELAWLIVCPVTNYQEMPDNVRLVVMRRKKDDPSIGHLRRLTVVRTDRGISHLIGTSPDDSEQLPIVGRQREIEISHVVLGGICDADYLRAMAFTS